MNCNQYRIFVLVILCCIVLCTGVLITTSIINKKVNSTSPVEEVVKIDSVSKVNNKLVIEVNNLDSIKDAKVIEAQTLDNDSTIKLFYILIRK